MKSLVVPIFTAALLALGPAALAQETAPEWAMKRAESALTFTADQSGSPIEGRFERFEAAIFFDPADPEAGRVEVTIHMASATTDDSMRDDTLKSEDLFHVEAYPTATFSADRFEKADGDDAYRAPGELTLRGVTRPVTLPFTLAIEGEGPGATAHAEGTITIDRLDFGVGQGDWAETDTVADPVDIGIDIRAVRQ